MSKKFWWAWGGLVIIGAAVVFFPVITRSGVDYAVSSRQLPLYEKAIYFVSRHFETQAYLAQSLREFRPESGAPDARAERLLDHLFRWVVTHVRRPPKGWPLVDDHPVYVLIRGYGSADQRAQALALLASYAGYPSAIRSATLRASPKWQSFFTLIRVEDKVYVFDVPNGVAFRKDDGQLVDYQTLIDHVDQVGEWVQGVTSYKSFPYDKLLTQLGQSPVRFSQMEAQKPLKRIWYVLRQALGQKPYAPEPLFGS